MSYGRLDSDSFSTTVEDGLRWSYGTTAEILRAIWLPDIEQGLLLVASPTSLARVEAEAQRFEGQRVEDPEVGTFFVGNRREWHRARGSSHVGGEWCVSGSRPPHS